MTKHTLCSLALLMTVLFQFPQRMAFAQDAAPRVIRKPAGDGFQPITDEDIQLMRKDIRSQRKQIIAANLKLTDAEAEKFWSVYEQYISDLVNINGTKYALIKRYVETGGALSDTEAETSTSQWVGLDQSVAELRKRYIPIFHKVLSPKNTALFYQLDRRVQLLIDLQLASSLPMIEPQPETLDAEWGGNVLLMATVTYGVLLAFAFPLNDTLQYEEPSHQDYCRSIAISLIRRLPRQAQLFPAVWRQELMRAY